MREAFITVQKEFLVMGKEDFSLPKIKKEIINLARRFEQDGWKINPDYLDESNYNFLNIIYMPSDGHIKVTAVFVLFKERGD